MEPLGLALERAGRCSAEPTTSPSRLDERAVGLVAERDLADAAHGQRGSATPSTTVMTSEELQSGEAWRNEVVEVVSWVSRFLGWSRR